MTARTERTVPIVLGVIAGVLLIAVVIALTVYLQRSAPNTDAAPAETASAPAPAAPADPADPAPSTPAEDPAAAAGIEITGDGFTLSLPDGSEFTHAWADDAAPAIAALTDVLGAAPTEGFQDGDAQNYAYDIYEWEGLRFYDVFLTEGNRPRAEVPAPTFLALTGPIDGVQTTDEFGLSVGMPIAEARELGPDVENSSAGGRVQLVFGADRGTFYSDGVRSFSAFVNSDAADQSVASITYTFNNGGR